MWPSETKSDHGIKDPFPGNTMLLILLIMWFLSIYSIFQGTPNDVKTLYPQALNRIKAISNSCKVEAVKVSNKYHLVMLVIQELNVASLNKQGLTEEREKETQLLIQMTEKEKESLSEEQEKIQQRLKKLEEEVEKYGSQLDEAIKSIPSGGKF